MSDVRTRQQSKANEFDADLYRLIGTATRLQDEFDMSLRNARPTGVNPWREVVGALYRARPYVRQQMHPHDRKDTE